MEFFLQASQFGDLYVDIGSDATYLEYKHRKPMFPQEERLFMVRNTKAKAKLGWNPQITSFEQLVQIMVEHDMAKVAADNVASKVRTNLAE